MTCKRCGKCCYMGPAGDRYVERMIQLFPADIRRWIQHDDYDVLNQVCFGIMQLDPAKHPTQQWTFQKNTVTGSCIFLDDGECRIYERRPLSCRVYPLYGKCYEGCEHAVLDREVRKAFERSWRDWQQWTLEKRQDVLKSLFVKLDELNERKRRLAVA